jgi:plasmid stabilization system protein ParE
MPLAVLDIRRLVKFVELKNQAAALAVNALLRQGVLALADFPERGRLGQIDDTRELILNSYVFSMVVKTGCPTDV